VGLGTKRGVHLEFVSEPGFELELAGMDLRSEGIRLINARTKAIGDGDEEETLATVYVPRGRFGVFEEKLRKYASELTPKKKQPRYEGWAAPIADIRVAALGAFWTDDREAFPRRGRSIWWEVWLASAAEEALSSFRETVSKLGLEVGTQDLRFPDRGVVLAYGSVDQLVLSIEVLDSIAELRKPKEIPADYMGLSALEMREWMEDLLRRVTLPGDEAPAVCLLDTGVNRQHPLIEPFLEEADTHAVHEAWGTDDHTGHGTEMAGVVLYGDLAESLSSSTPVEVPVKLESVKVLPRVDENPVELWGRVTQQAVARVEIERPDRRRSHVMAIAATATRDRGRPSSWSGAVDQLAAGTDDDQRRLLILCAGNERNNEAWLRYPAHLATSEVHDPGQAWNALTVGACTDRWQIDEEDFEGWEAVAPPGDLSPMSSTSATWQHRWPIKPDVVLEGGNAARDSSGRIDTPDSLGLLTTFFRHADRSFTVTRGTSPASAQAGRMAGVLQRRYPQLWPETVRALLVHSARWTGQMRQRFAPLTNKGALRNLVRFCGFGVPSLERALWSAGNRLTLIVQDELQPFTKLKDGKKKTKPQLNEMHLHDLPWPREQLLDLGEVTVALRVTLSYFVEPSPGERGWQSRYRYASHGLRFDVRGSSETESEFRKRLNKAARDEDGGSPETADHSGWTLGPQLRHRGSIHSDLWTGSAADLATRKQVGIYPTGGWWNERHHLDRWNRRARYSVVVSIETPEIEVDLYTPVANQIGVPIEISSDLGL